MYVLGSDVGKPLILDCEYEISPNETGLVVKWLFNGINIYQWIPNQNPHSLGNMKKHIDMSHSTDTNKAISIVDPQWNMTGNYSCSVQTFQGESKQTSELKIINPEREFHLVAEKDEEEDDLKVTCSVEDIFPTPNLAILINGAQPSIEITVDKDKEASYDVKATSKKSLNEIETPATITCILSIPGTEYEKRQETVFNDVVEMIDNDLIDERNEDTLSRLEATAATSHDNGTTQYPITILVLLCLFLSTYS